MRPKDMLPNQSGSISHQREIFADAASDDRQKLFGGAGIIIGGVRTESFQSDLIESE